MTEQADREAEADEARLATIRASMGTAEYWAKPELQAEYLRLVEARGRRNVSENE